MNDHDVFTRALIRAGIHICTAAIAADMVIGENFGRALFFGVMLAVFCVSLEITRE